MKIKVITSAVVAILALGTRAMFAVPESSDLIGSDVVNKAGEKIGSLKEFLLDPNSKGLQFAVVERGGVLGMGAKTFLIPWEIFEVQQNAEDNTTRVMLDATVEKLQGAVEYDSNKPVPAEQVYAYWGVHREAQGTPKNEPSGKDAGASSAQRK